MKLAYKEGKLFNSDGKEIENADINKVYKGPDYYVLEASIRVDMNPKKTTKSPAKKGEDNNES
ncbi:hypothetical protein [Spirochaeta cellobiosiphila]|uniref:hypothetical protein n=1 Tax=Spirochaeta cellobiosiphila TaxID=504483 RepID=UPI0003F55E05|nr:hypothetical protein [Spirochaeta cellobiosiphila]